MFVEELVSLVTLQICPCKNGIIFEMWMHCGHEVQHKTVSVRNIKTVLQGEFHD
jgi:hypothetical protein